MADNIAQTIINELRQHGASDSAIRGVLANVKDESNFNPSSRVPDQPNFSGEAHFAHGLYQEGGDEWNNYSNYVSKNGGNWQDPALQTRFLAQNLKANYPKVWDAMNRGSPEDAAQSFASGYLKPSAQILNARNAAYAKGIPQMDNYVSGAPATPPAAATDSFQGALDDFNTHMGTLQAKYPHMAPQGQQQQPGGGAGAQPTLQQNAMMMLMRPQQQPQAAPQQVNYGGISSPNYAAAGPSTGMSNMLSLMMQNKFHANVLAGLNQQNNGGGQSQ